MLEKVWDDYEEIHRIDVKGLDYKEIKYSNKENKGDNDFNYYYEIKIDDKINTGIFRIGKNGNEKGQLWMDSLKEFSDVDTDENSGSDNNIDNGTDYNINTDTENTNKETNNNTDSNNNQKDNDTEFIIMNPGAGFNLKFNYLLLMILLFI